jgi:tRNA threonylcarbamoyl adenosine modification protein YeaZ
VLILAFDTSTPTGSIAVLRDRNVLGEIINASKEPYSITFFNDLDKLLLQLDLALQQFDLFAVGAGPGSFTGVRTGLTTAKAWSEIYGKPIAPVSCLAALASKLERSRFRSPEALIAAVADARRGQIFGCVYRFVEACATAPPALAPVTPTLVSVIDEVVLSADEFIEIVTGLVRRVPASPNSSNDGPGPGPSGPFGTSGPLPIFVSASPDVIRPALEHSTLSGAPVEQVSGALAAQIGELGYFKAVRGDVVDALALEANYIRRPDAERNWKGP